jgi:magnesium transporter
MRTLYTFAGERRDPSDREVLDGWARSDKNGFWLDIEDPTDEDYELLLDRLHFHPLTVEDIQQQNSRPKLEQYTGYLFAVVFTALVDKGRLRYQEHHLYFARNAIVTAHHGRSAELSDLFQRLADHKDLAHGDVSYLAYLVVNALTDQMFGMLDQLDDEIDSLEDLVLSRPTSRTLSQLYRIKHSVIDLRRILGAQREVFQHLVTHASEYHSQDTAVYYRDVYDHVVRQYETVDSLRDLITGTMDVYLSTVSNRLNTNIQKLTVIASLFLPLTFLTGFFGMNFGYLVQHITAPFAFAAVVLLMAATVVVQLALFRSRRWI